MFRLKGNRQQANCDNYMEGILQTVIVFVRLSFHTFTFILLFKGIYYAHLFLHIC